MQNTYKIGDYWKNIDKCKERGICPKCKMTEDMEHILTKCDNESHTTAWKLANDLWKKDISKTGMKPPMATKQMKP